MDARMRDSLEDFFIFLKTKKSDRLYDLEKILRDEEADARFIPDEIIEKAYDMGYDFTKGDLYEFLKERLGVMPLSSDDLMKASGGSAGARRGGEESSSFGGGRVGKYAVAGLGLAGMGGGIALTGMWHNKKDAQKQQQQAVQTVNENMDKKAKENYSGANIKRNEVDMENERNKFKVPPPERARGPVFERGSRGPSRPNLFRGGKGPSRRGMSPGFSRAYGAQRATSGNLRGMLASPDRFSDSVAERRKSGDRILGEAARLLGGKDVGKTKKAIADLIGRLGGTAGLMGEDYKNFSDAVSSGKENYAANALVNKIKSSPQLAELLAVLLNKDNKDALKNLAKAVDQASKLAQGKADFTAEKNVVNGSSAEFAREEHTVKESSVINDFKKYCDSKKDDFYKKLTDAQWQDIVAKNVTKENIDGWDKLDPKARESDFDKIRSIGEKLIKAEEERLAKREENVVSAENKVAKILKDRGYSEEDIKGECSDLKARILAIDEKTPDIVKDEKGNILKLGDTGYRTALAKAIEDQIVGKKADTLKSKAREEFSSVKGLSFKESDVVSALKSQLKVAAGKNNKEAVSDDTIIRDAKGAFVAKQLNDAEKTFDDLKSGKDLISFKGSKLLIADGENKKELALKDGTTGGVAIVKANCIRGMESLIVNQFALMSGKKDSTLESLYVVAGEKNEKDMAIKALKDAGCKFSIVENNKALGENGFLVLLKDENRDTYSSAEKVIVGQNGKDIKDIAEGMFSKGTAKGASDCKSIPFTLQNGKGAFAVDISLGVYSQDLLRAASDNNDIVIVIGKTGRDRDQFLKAAGISDSYGKKDIKGSWGRGEDLTVYFRNGVNYDGIKGELLKDKKSGMETKVADMSSKVFRGMIKKAEEKAYETEKGALSGRFLHSLYDKNGVAKKGGIILEYISNGKKGKISFVSDVKNIKDTDLKNTAKDSNIIIGIGEDKFKDKLPGNQEDWIELTPEKSRMSKRWDDKLLGCVLYVKKPADGEKALTIANVADSKLEGNVRVEDFLKSLGVKVKDLLNKELEKAEGKYEESRKKIDFISNAEIEDGSFSIEDVDAKGEKVKIVAFSSVKAVENVSNSIKNKIKTGEYIVLVSQKNGDKSDDIVKKIQETFKFEDKEKGLVHVTDRSVAGNVVKFKTRPLAGVATVMVPKKFEGKLDKDAVAEAEYTYKDKKFEVSDILNNFIDSRKYFESKEKLSGKH